MNAVRVLARHEDIVDDHVRTLEKKQAKELERRRSDRTDGDQHDAG